MAENNNVDEKAALSSKDDMYEIMSKKLKLLKAEAHNAGLPSITLLDILLNFREGSSKHVPKCQENSEPVKKQNGAVAKRYALIIFVIVILSAVTCGPLLLGGSWDRLHRSFMLSRCLVDQHFVVMEASRPLADCNVCRGVDAAVLLDANVTREEFAHHAYAGRPVLVKGAAMGWSATRVFSFDFFRQLYTEIESALDSVENECQFFPFRSPFNTLRDVFAMTIDQAGGRDTDKRWYIGWSNCNPKVAAILRKHYDRPHFLPADSEASSIDWIFMGWAGQGASIHLDYVQRPSWQAQISGRKRWKLLPVPECEHVCGHFELMVEKGDIVLIDTNQWYHDTFIEQGEMSITIGSEYD